VAKEPKPDFSCQTNDKLNSVVDVPCKKTCKVIYRFAFKSKLSLPYAVAINGKVLPAFKDRPKRTDEKIPVVVEAGQTVQLYLNSDAHPAFRQHPVYLVRVGEEDVDVLITEVSGKHADSDTPIRGKVSRNEATGLSVQHMSAKLTGDIWMKVSHRYTFDEVDARVPPGTSEEVKNAIKKIYKGLSAATLTIERPGQGAKPPHTLTVKFVDSSNPKDNITSYALLSDGLTRVHPGGYAALINAALEAEVQSISVSSCWRPMLGSIAHRAGLGLDVSVLGGTTMNREELRRALKASKTGPDGNGNGNDKDNVTNAEVKAFGEYEQALLDTKRAEADKTAADKAASEAIKSGNADAIRNARERQVRAQNAVRDATRAEQVKRDAWDGERDKGEPNHVRQYRISLLKCVCVRQLFDPWFMYANVKDGSEPEPNLQRPLPKSQKGQSNEELHAHHLHITVDDAKIL
jgi:hypothetical protein